ncbi:MAG: hypothetical protein ABI790_09865 [Betaproteobacteria bacterium]
MSVVPAAGMIGAVVMNEVRVRMRRLSSLVALMAVVAISWAMVVDPGQGEALITVGKRALVYSSAVLAVGSSGLAAILFGLAGFYLVRGRTRDDLICGLGSVLAATPMRSSVFLFARWLGAAAYLFALMLALMATMLVVQWVRGVPPLQPLVYLQTYLLLVLPTLLLVASFAVLCDAYAPLMGKGGDVLYFLFWIGQFTAVPVEVSKQSGGPGALAAIDISGLAAVMSRFRQLFNTNSFAIGGNTYDMSLPPLPLNDFWTGELIAMRLVCMLVATLPLFVAIALFHRYSPDRVKAVSARKSFSLLALVNRLLRPATRLVRPLFTVAARLPGIAGQALADAALTLTASPAALVAMLGLFAAGVLASPASLPGVLVAAIACWGILISDLAVRDYQSSIEAMTAAVPGGGARRFTRQLMVTALLGYLCTAPILARWLTQYPLRAAALVTGILALSAAASLFGRMTRTGRTFLALFLFGLYAATQVKSVAWWDVVGFNGVADMQSIGAQSVFAVAAAVLGYLYNKRKGNT